MQDDQQADAQIANEPVPPASCAMPPKKRGRLVTFFAKMYSPHGTLTCKEFVWSALYIITMGKLLSALSLAPIYLVNIISPLRDLDILYKWMFTIYILGVHIAVFLYPIYNICMKILHGIKLKKLYISTILIILIAVIESHAILLDKENLAYYISGYLLFILLIAVCFLLKNISDVNVRIP